MEETQTQTLEGAFDLGKWLGRKQAFSLVSGRCSTADAECLHTIREQKLYRSLGKTWEQFCDEDLGVTRGYADRLVRQYQQLGPNYSRLNCFTRISATQYRLIADAVSDDGVSFNGEVIPLDAENSSKLADAVEALVREHTPEAEPADPAEHSFARAERSLTAAFAEFQRLQSMNLDEDNRLRLVVAAEGARDRFDQIRLTTEL